MEVHVDVDSQRACSSVLPRTQQQPLGTACSSRLYKRPIIVLMADRNNYVLAEGSVCDKDPSHSFHGQCD